MVPRRPLAGGQFDLSQSGCWSHTQASLQCGSGKNSSTNVDLNGYRESLNHSCWGRYSGVMSVVRRASLQHDGIIESRWMRIRHGRLFFGRHESRAGPDRRGQAPKGTGGMPRRHQMAGVEGRERSGGAAQRASIPEYPLDTWGTETSQYPQEQKSTETPSVAASERGPA